MDASIYKFSDAPCALDGETLSENAEEVLGANGVRYPQCRGRLVRMPRASRSFFKVSRLALRNVGGS